MRATAPVLSAFFAVLPFVSASVGAQKPGEIYREYTWRANPWQRIIGPDSTHATARQLLPNRTNRVTIGDLKDAVRAEVIVEKLTSHAGSAGPKLRMNGTTWRDIPFPSRALIPGARGNGSEAIMYMMHYYPKVEVPLSELREGTNTINMTCTVKGSHGFATLWPQFIVYGVTVRVYYSAAKAHTRGEITGVRAGDVLGSDPKFGVRTWGGSVRRVEYLGDYDHFNYRGDDSQGWVRSRLRGELQHHIGTSKSSPWGVTWDTEWVPTQTRPFRVVALVRDDTDLIFVTPAVTGLTLSRNKTVVRHMARKIPWAWVTNYWARFHECFVDVPGDLSKAEDARLFMTTWNGYECDEIGLNNQRLVRRIGRDHELSWDELKIDPAKLQSGTNQLYTKFRGQSHGIEVQWPGIEVFVRYDIPEGHAQFAPFGVGCKHGNTLPVLGIRGEPRVGQSYELVVTGGVPNEPFLLTWGLSNRMYQTTALPWKLDARGAPGCIVWTSIDSFSPYKVDAQGRASVRVDMPNAPALVGKHFFNQAILVGPGVNRIGTLVTNGSRTLIGR